MHGQHLYICSIPKILMVKMCKTLGQDFTVYMYIPYKYRFQMKTVFSINHKCIFKLVKPFRLTKLHVLTRLPMSFCSSKEHCIQFIHLFM